MVLGIFRTESTDTDNLNHREHFRQDYLQLQVLENCRNKINTMGKSITYLLLYHHQAQKINRS